MIESSSFTKMLLFGVVAAALLFSPTCLAENSGSGSISTDEIEDMIYDAIDENNEVVKQMIDDRIELHDQNNAECLSRGMFYNTMVNDCTPCSSCKNLYESCFFICQGMFAQEQLKDDNKVHWMHFKIMYSALGVSLVLLLAVGAYARHQVKKLEDSINNIKFKPASGDDDDDDSGELDEKNENECFLDSTTCMITVHAQETAG